MGLAERFGCSAEAVRFRCPDSSWLGEVISGMSMAHWLAIFAIPSAILGAIGLLISLILKVKRSDANPSVVPRAAFYRSRHKVFAGVCYALARLWNLPILGVRIVTVILAIVIPGFIFLYFWCWLAFPIEPQSQQPVTIMIRKDHQNPHHPKTTLAGQLVCPHCQMAFPITWRRYWSAPFGGRKLPGRGVPD